MSSLSTLSGNPPGLAPAFTTLSECEAWLPLQPLASTVQMQSVLQRQLGLLNRHNLPATERLAILETLREQVYRTQEGCVSRFAGRPMPLAPPELAAFESSQATWRAFSEGYVRCLEVLLTGEIAIRPRAALIIQRILATLTDMQTDIYRSGQLPHAEHWQNLHRAYETAEQLEATLETVKDKLRTPDGSVTVTAGYAEAMLLHAASPFELSQRHMGWVARWARRWAPKITISTERVEDASAAPLYVALDRNEPASHFPSNSIKLCVLATADLRHSLKKRLQLLAKGDSPASLHLGDDCTQPACEHLLQQTYQRWCKQGNPRRHERHAGNTNCTMFCGLNNVHQSMLGGKAFRAPGEVSIGDLRREREHMATFGTVLDPSATGTFVVTPSEQWSILDHSATGMRLHRIPAENQSRLAAGMLLAAQLPGSSTHLLGVVRWTLLLADDSMEIGLLLIPGQPQALSISSKAANGKYEHARALLLPAIAALKEASSLIIPNGWFQPGRLVELNEGESRTIRLGQPLERGSDFDRVTFSDTKPNTR